MSKARKTRRDFLQHGAAIALTGGYLASNSGSPAFAANWPAATREKLATPATPDHLPQNLTRLRRGL